MASKLRGLGRAPVRARGGIAMVVLIVIAVVWLSVRVAAALLLVIRGPDSDCLTSDHLKGRRRPHDAAHAMDGPQDAPFAPQDAVRADVEDLDRSSSVLHTTTVNPTLAIAAAMWRKVTRANGELGAGCSLALEGERSREWLAALRETISCTVPRPIAGPAYLGGRDDAAYLRGWDDAADWIGAGHDAEAPTWGDVAYMTGWNDAVRDIARARSCATSWPSPETVRIV